MNYIGRIGKVTRDISTGIKVFVPNPCTYRQVVPFNLILAVRGNRNRLIRLNAGIVRRGIYVPNQGLHSTNIFVRECSGSSELHISELKFCPNLDLMLTRNLACQGTLRNNCVRFLSKAAKVHARKNCVILVSAYALSRPCDVVPGIVEIVVNPVFVIKIVLSHTHVIEGRWRQRMSPIQSVNK